MSNRRRSKSAAAAAASLLVLGAASNAQATVVCNTAPPIPYDIPNNIDGVYLNLVTNAFQTSAPTAGWDFNPYNNNTGLNFFFPATTAGVVGNGTTHSVLNSGDPIGPAQTYSAATNPGSAFMTNWRATNTGKYVGIRFTNEGTGALNYGWIQLDTTASSGTNLGFPATIRGYCYQNNGTAITAGTTTPVELEAFSIE